MRKPHREKRLSEIRAKQKRAARNYQERAALYAACAMECRNAGLMEDAMDAQFISSIFAKRARVSMGLE